MYAMDTTAMMAFHECRLEGLVRSARPRRHRHHRPPRQRLAAPWLPLAEAEHARAADGSHRVERWATAVARCDEFGMPCYAAYARDRPARALLGDRGIDDVPDLLRSAHDVACELGAQPLVDDLLALARRARIDQHATIPTGGPGSTMDPIQLQ